MKMPKCTSQLEDYSRPWAIIRLLPDARRYTVARFFHRQDAEDHRRFLNRFMPAAEFEVLLKITGTEWNKLTGHIAQIGRLVGSRFPRIKGWSDLERHLSYHEVHDFRDIKYGDWPAVKKGLYEIVYGQNAPVRVETNDLSALVAAKPSGAVATKLKWENLIDEEFERLIFCLILGADGYENPKWQTRTNAPERGQDLSVTRVQQDSLSGTFRSEVIIQCKHWLKKSVNPNDVSHALVQMKVREPNTVDVLIIATSGRITDNADVFVKNHNRSKQAPYIELWTESHLEHLLALRPHLITKFQLR